MTCTEIQPELVAYHFGDVSDEARGAVEEHLLGCARCLKDFLALKREIETGESGPRPSPAARARLRAAVAEELGVCPRPARAWSWWERPLAFGFAGSAVIGAVMAVRLLAAGSGAPPHSLGAGTPPAPAVIVPAPSR
jgi:anti-sigma factor RsiW